MLNLQEQLGALPLKATIERRVEMIPLAYGLHKVILLHARMDLPGQAMTVYSLCCWCCVVCFTFVQIDGVVVMDSKRNKYVARPLSVFVESE